MNQTRYQNQYPENWDKLRRIVYKRDKYTCQYCGERKNGPINAHHIKPLYKGGNNNLNNLICVCPQCHLILHYFIWNKGDIIDSPFPEITNDEIFLNYNTEIFLDEHEQGFHSIEDNI